MWQNLAAKYGSSTLVLGVFSDGRSDTIGGSDGRTD